MAYTSLSVLKDYLGIPSGTTSEDTPLTAAINAAQDLVDGYCNTTFETVTEARVYRADDPQVLLVDQFHTLTGLVVKTDTSNDGTYDTTLTITTDFVVQPFNEPPFTSLLNVSGDWPRYESGRPAVEVTAAYGELMNHGDQTVTISAITADLGSEAQMHDVLAEGDQRRMVQMATADIAPGDSLVFE